MRNFLPVSLLLALACLVQACPLLSVAAEPASAPARPLVFCRGQFKYPLYGNYTRRWLDRPLLHDRSLLAENEPYLHVNYASFARMVEVGRSYELDGFAFFPQNPGMHFTSDGRKTSIYEFSDRAYAAGFGLLPEFTAAADAASFDRALSEALASKSVVRIGGKVLITSYVADSNSPEQWKTILTELRNKHGDKFLFLPDLTRLGGRPLHEWIEAFDSGKPIGGEQRKALEAYLRCWLEVCDGLYFAETPHLRTKDRKFHAAFYRDFIIPLYQKVLSEPAYRGKLLGLTAAMGYFMPESGVGTSEDGTKTLRHSFEAAAAARPAVINMPEWDEENENTCIRPTVYNSFSTQRILKYYMRRLRGQPPAANPGDDPSVPNLVVSYRKLLVLGERLEVEVLNVPDTDRPGQLSVTVALKDLGGRVVKQFPPQTLASQELADRTVAVPTEELARYAVLIPSLTVERDGKKQVFEEGLHSIQVRATWNWDRKWVKQPLRDLCRPTNASFAFVPSPDLEPAERRLAGAFACGEDLAFLEVLEDDDVAYACDPCDEYLRDNPDYVLLAIERRALRRVRLTGSITVRDAAGKWLGPDVFHHWARDYRLDGNRLFLNSNVDWYVRSVYLAVPKADLEKAVLDFDCNLFKSRVPVKQVVQRGIYSETHADGLSLTVSRQWKQPNIPYRLNKRSAEFVATVRPELNTSVFHLRAITIGGKIYYSRPLVVGWPSQAAIGSVAVGATSARDSALSKPGQSAVGKTARSCVHSDTAGRAVPVEVDAARVPDLAYEFSPQRGAVLFTPAGRPFWGILGGYTDSATGRGGAEGGGGTPFRQGTRGYPPNARQTAPQWIEEEGRTCLKFDGVGNYLLLPLEALPLRAGFRLTMEIKPTANKPQTVFTCRSYYVGSLTVNLDRGKLCGVYVDRRLRSHRLNSSLAVETGKWSTIEVVYDQASLRFVVNGKASEAIAAPGPGMYLGMSVVGGLGEGGPVPGGQGNVGWFEGLLRALRIVHSPEIP